MENKSAVIFDLDGTLLDSLEDLAYVINTVLEQNGFQTHPVDAYKYFVGDGVRTAVARASECENEQMLEAMTTAVRELYNENLAKRSRLYEGVDSLLSGLEEIPVKKAILSNKPHELTLRCQELFLQKWSFDAVYGHREGVPKKPDPFSAQELAESFCVNPAEIVYVGDTSTDMKTAKSAGMLAVGVTWGFRDEKELRESGADMIVNHPNELLAFMTEKVNQA